MISNYKTFSTLFSCLIAVSLSFTAHGQSASNHTFGFEGGGGISFLRGLENIEKYHEPAMCFAVGFSYQNILSERFSFFSAIDYERKGSVANVAASDLSGNIIGDFVVHLNYDYLVLPLLGRYSIGEMKMLYINAGPYAGLLLRSKSVTDANDIVIIPHTELDLTEDSYAYDFGFSAGIGIQIPVSRLMTISVEIRNNLGMVNTRRAVNDQDDGSVKMNSTNLLIGVKMPL